MDEYNKDHQKFLDDRSADPSQAGFNFQFYAFLYLILKMDKDSYLGYEMDDDILYIQPNQVKTLIQAKNAIRNDNGSWPNLTIRDKDLWHTIDNWVTQLELSKDSIFFENRTFEIWTNKNFGKNSFYELIKEFKAQNIKIEAIDKELNSLIDDTVDKEIKNAMKKLKSISNTERKRFYLNFTVRQFEGFSIIQEIKDTLKYKGLPENRIESIYSSLQTEFRDSHFIKSCKREKTKLSSEEMHEKCVRIFNRAYDRTLHIDRIICKELPLDIYDQTFVKQLIDIDHIGKTEAEQIRDIYTTKLGTYNAIIKFTSNGNREIDDTDLINIHKEAYQKWKTEFDISNDNIRRQIRNLEKVTNNESNIAGRECFKNIRRYEIAPMDQEMTLGYYYDMSDTPEIGWRHDWVEKYKTD